MTICNKWIVNCNKLTFSVLKLEGALWNENIDVNLDGLHVVPTVRARTVSMEPWTRWTMKEVQRRTPVRMVSDITHSGSDLEWALTFKLCFSHSNNIISELCLRLCLLQWLWCHEGEAQVSAAFSLLKAVTLKAQWSGHSYSDLLILWDISTAH